MKILLTGGSGMLGEALRRIAQESFQELEVSAPSRSELPLGDRGAVNEYFREQEVDCVIHSAAKVGGIQSNIDNPVEFLVENIDINTNVISSAAENRVSKLLFVGSSCMYPKDYRQPLKETDILQAPLEPTNEGYALAKIVGAKHCEYLSRVRNLHYRTIIPCNLFGVNDAFGSEASHLIAAIVTKVCSALDEGESAVEIWGKGDARREFLFVDDLATFMLEILPRLGDLPNCLNLGYGQDFSVNEYYRMVAEAAGYEGEFTHDLTRPVGMMKKLVDSTLAETVGWQPKTSMRDAVATVVSEFRKRHA